MRWRRALRRGPDTSPAPAVRVALLGAGGDAGVFALAARAAGMSVTAVASDDAALAAARARESGGVALTLEALLERSAELADLVIVTLPAEVRAGAAARLAIDGVRAIVPPPLSDTLAAADSLLASVEGASGSVRYGEHLLRAPVIRRFLDRLDAIGEPTYVEVRALDGRRDATTALLDAERGAGGSVLVALGSRAVALAIMVMDRISLGRPTSVRAELLGDGPAPERDVLLSLAVADERVAVRVHVAHDRAAGPAWDLQVAGTVGVVRAELLPMMRLEVNGDEVPSASITEADDAMVLLGYTDLLREAASDRPVDPDRYLGATFGAEVLGVVSAAAASAARGGEAVALPFDGPRWLAPDALLRGG